MRPLESLPITIHTVCLPLTSLAPSGILARFNLPALLRIEEEALYNSGAGGRN